VNEPLDLIKGEPPEAFRTHAKGGSYPQQGANPDASKKNPKEDCQRLA
jgi:hypothetical protein